MKDLVSRVGGAVGAGVRSAARSGLSPAVLTGAAVEIAWVATHVALYPTGLTRERSLPEELSRFSVHELPPLRRALLIGDVEAAGTPILLVHGIVDNRSVFTLLRRRLHRRGFGRVATMNYSPLTDDVRSAATLLAERVEELCDQTGYERIHVVGHSLGGFIARYYVQRLGGDARVETLVTLGSPHRGTRVAHLVPHPLVRQLRPGSPIVAELAAPAPGCRTRFLAFYSNLDHLIVPSSNARIDHPDLIVRNVLAPGVGHTSLPVRARVVHEICATLAHLDTDGSGVRSKVTSITSAGANPQRRARGRQGFTTSVRQTFGHS